MKFSLRANFVAPRAVFVYVKKKEKEVGRT